MSWRIADKSWPGIGRPFLVVYDSQLPESYRYFVFDDILEMTEEDKENVVSWIYLEDIGRPDFALGVKAAVEVVERWSDRVGEALSPYDRDRLLEELSKLAEGKE